MKKHEKSHKKSKLPKLELFNPPQVCYDGCITFAILRKTDEVSLWKT